MRPESSTPVRTSATSWCRVIVPTLVALVTWRGSFVVAGSFGIVWLIFWLIYYRRPEEHRRVSKAELALILSDPGEKIEKRSMEARPAAQRDLGLCNRQGSHRSRLVVLSFLDSRLSAGNFSPEPFAKPDCRWCWLYAISTVGSIGGGWISASHVNRGKSPNIARKTAMLICVLCIAAYLCHAFRSSPVGGRGIVGPGHSRAPGMVGKPVHLAVRYVSQSRCRQRHRHRRHGRRRRRSSVAVVYRLYRLSDAQLCAAVYRLRASAYPLALLIIHVITPKLAPARLD